MGFLRRLFRGPRKKSSTDSKRNFFVRSLDDPSGPNFPSANAATSYGGLDANKHAIAVAAATAAVAEAALAAAQAAAEVVRLTSSGVGAGGRAAISASPEGTHAQLPVEELAALRIQSAFRGYLARRALRALKALVKLQALVRGNIVRKQMADMLRRMQTLVRVQARARATRSYPSVSSVTSTKSSLSQHPRSLSNANYRDSIEMNRTKFGSNWLDSWMGGNVWDNGNPAGPPRNSRYEDESSAKILEVDTWKPHFNSQTNQGSITSSSNHAIDPDCTNKTFMPVDSPFKHSSRPPNPLPSLLSEEAVSLSPVNYPEGMYEKFRSAENSPQVVMGSSRPGSRRSPFTPTRSECSWGYFNSYSSHPNYMANTESSRAKVRSQSAPRQRLEFDRLSSSKRLSLQGSWDSVSGTNSERGYPLNADPRKRAHQATNQLNRLGSANMR